MDTQSTVDQNQKEVISCPKCKENIIKGATLCKHCGSKIEDSSKNNAGAIGCLVLLVFVFVAIWAFGNIGSNDEVSESTISNNQKVNEKYVPSPGDEVFLRLNDANGEGEGYVYVVDTFENFKVMLRSFESNDPESSFDLIESGHMVAVVSGTEVRILSSEDAHIGSEKIRILEGEHKNFVGYVISEFVKEK